MTKLIELQSQIEKLQKQASELRSKEFHTTVEEIRRLMNAYGISVKDLQDTKNKGKPGRKSKAGSDTSKKPQKAKAAVAAKYKGPAGETWSGRGLMPKWLSALVEQGQPKENFLIQASA